MIVPVNLENRWNKDPNEPQNLDRDRVEVMCFDFQKQIEDILADTELFGNKKNMVIIKLLDDSSKKWLLYQNVGDFLFQVFDEDWYQSYARNMVTDLNNKFCFPIGINIDASETVTYQRYTF